MKDDVLTTVDSVIIDICDDLKKRNHGVNARAELTTALAELLRARADHLKSLNEVNILTEEITLLEERKEWLDEMRKSGKLY